MDTDPDGPAWSDHGEVQQRGEETVAVFPDGSEISTGNLMEALAKLYRASLERETAG